MAVDRHPAPVTAPVPSTPLTRPAEPPPDPGPPALDAPAAETWKLDEDTEVRVLVPSGIREKRPIVVGVHGAHDRADWACDKWNATFAGFAFVVCPQGVPWWPHRAWGAPSLLAERADRGIAAVRERYAAHVADGPVVYGGFSQGGTLASQVLAIRPGVYDTVVLVEVGHTRLNAIWATANLRKGLARRVIVACSTFPCMGFAKNMRAAARQKDLPFFVSEAGVGRGHFFDEITFRALGATMAEALSDDPRWSGLREAVASKWSDGDVSAPGSSAAAPR